MDRLRTWSNGLAVGGLILAIGIAVLTTSKWALSDWRWWATLGGFVCFAALATWLLRPPRPLDTKDPLQVLLERTSVRDLAMLRTATTYILYPKLVSDRALSLAPPSVPWEPESEVEAQKRAHRLIELGLLQWRNTEVETTALGRQLVELDDSQDRVVKSN